MIFHDVCLANQHVVFAIDRAGLVADDGQTHQGIYDVGMFLQMPNMTVLCPSGISEMESMLRYATYELDGPVTIRYPRGTANRFISAGPPYEPILLKNDVTGNDVVLIAYGRMIENVMDAADLLDTNGLRTAVIKLTEISAPPIDKLLSLIGSVESVYIVEECVSGGCLASKLSLELSTAGYKGKTIAINLGNAVIPSAGVEELMQMYKLDAAGIAETVFKNKGPLH